MSTRYDLPALLAQLTEPQKERFWAENPHLRDQRPVQPSDPAKSQPLETVAPPKRLRQSTKPLLNKLETAFFLWMKATHPEITLRPQAITLKIANGLRYTPDFFALVDWKPTFWETKGKWVDGDSFPKLKMAAAAFPECDFTLVWRSGGEWKFQEVLA